MYLFSMKMSWLDIEVHLSSGLKSFVNVPGEFCDDDQEPASKFALSKLVLLLSH